MLFGSSLQQIPQSSYTTDMKGFISLFSGAGGLDLGLEQSGWTCRYACDNDANAVASLHENEQLFPSYVTGNRLTAEECDVRDLDGKTLLAKLGHSLGDLPLMAGGPPCQSWSSAGHQRGLEDPRGQLFHDFVRIADQCDCKILLFENVRGLLTARGPQGEPGGALRLIRETMWDGAIGVHLS